MPAIQSIFCSIQHVGELNTEYIEVQPIMTATTSDVKPYVNVTGQIITNFDYIQVGRIMPITHNCHSYVVG